MTVHTVTISDGRSIEVRDQSDGTAVVMVQPTGAESTICYMTAGAAAEADRIASGIEADLRWMVQRS